MKFGVFYVNHAFTQSRGQESFELIEDVSTGCCGWDQFHQVHIAWWVEEVHAAEALFQIGVETFRQSCDRQARSV